MKKTILLMIVLAIASSLSSVAYAVTYHDSGAWKFEGSAGDETALIDALYWHAIDGTFTATAAVVPGSWTINNYDSGHKVLATTSTSIIGGFDATLNYAITPSTVRLQAHKAGGGWSYVWQTNSSITANGGYPLSPDLAKGDMAFAAAVPEPGTILAALSILGPAGLVFRRRKA